MSYFKTISKRLQWKKTFPLADQLLVSGSHFLVQIVLARALGIEQYGVFTALWLVVILLSSFHQSFIIAPMMTIGPQHKNPTKYFSSVVWIQLLLSVTLFIVGTLTAFVLQTSNFFTDIDYLVLLPVMAIGFISHDFFRKLFYSMKQERHALILDIGVYGIQLIGLGIFYFSGQLTIASAILIISMSYLVGIVILFISKLRSFGISPMEETLNRHWTFSKWLVAKSGLQWLSGNLFLIAAGSILGAAALGIVRMAQNVIGVLNILFLTIENTVPVKAADILNVEGKKNLNKFFTKLSRNSGLAVLLVLIFLAVFSKSILGLIYGEVSLETVWVLRGFCFLYMIVFFSTIKRLHIRTLEANHQIFAAYLISAVFSILAAYPMISSWGLPGVVLGFIITQLISLVYYSIYLNRNQINI